MKIMFVGDINLGEYYTSFGNGPGTLAKTRYLFSEVHGLFDSADLVVGNLEASISDINEDPNDPERMVLRVDPEVRNQFKRAGFGVLQVANNHSIQHGEQAFKQSVEFLTSMGISPVGLNHQEPVVLSKDGVSIGFLAASDVPDNTDKSQSLYQRIDDDFFNIIKKSVNTVDHLVVMLHWGLEASTVPLPYQRKVAQQLKEMGVRAVIGSHTHLFYEVESSQNFVCAYSLGNFVFDLCWDKRLLKSGILELEFNETGISGNVWPVTINENGCVPVVSGEPVALAPNVTLYDHGKNMDGELFRKISYLFKNIFKGRTLLKLKFLASKLPGS